MFPQGLKASDLSKIQLLSLLWWQRFLAFFVNFEPTGSIINAVLLSPAKSSSPGRSLRNFMLVYAAQFSKSLYPILDQNMKFFTPIPLKSVSNTAARFANKWPCPNEVNTDSLRTYFLFLVVFDKESHVRSWDKFVFTFSRFPIKLYPTSLRIQTRFETRPLLINHTDGNPASSGIQRENPCQKRRKKRVGKSR